MSMVIEEWIYDLERDEEAMLKRIKETNLKASSVEGFLYSRVGGLGSLEKSKGTQTLDNVIDKKRVLRDKRLICRGAPCKFESLNLEP